MANGKGWKALTIASLGISAILVTAVIVIYWYSSTTVILLVRHADRNENASCEPPDPASTCPLPNPGSDNPPLSTPGNTRAQTLMHVGEDTGLQAIYASCFCRTQQTAAPIATNLGLTVNNVRQDGSANIDALVEQIKSDNEGQKILVVGHSNTVPLIIEKLGGGTVDTIVEEEFDNLYVVTIVKWWFWKHVRVVRLKYGVPT